MARDGIPERRHYTTPRYTPSASRKQVKCKFCLDAYNKAPDEHPAPTEVACRPKNLLIHLAEKCTHAPSNVREAAKKKLRPTQTKKRKLEDEFDDNHDQSQVQEKPQESIQWTSHQERRFEQLLLEFQHDNLLPDSFIERKSTERLLEYIAPGIKDYLPCRKTLGGPILRKHAQLCDAREAEALKKKQQKTGGRVNLLSDVWQNVSRDHLLGCQLTLFSHILTLKLLRVGARHDGLIIVQQLEGVIEVQHPEWDLGSCVTDNASQCRRARNVLQLRWPRMVFLHCFAHMINNLVKSVLKACFKQVASQASAVAACLNNSSSKWLRLALDWMMATYGEYLAIMTLCDTRWNSMQGNFASLLRVRVSLERLHSGNQNRKDFPPALRVLGEQIFWEKLTVAEEVIRPLSKASYRLQREANTLADVVIPFKEMYAGFKKHEAFSPALIRCLEARWEECEQPLFLLGFALHPHLREEAVKLIKCQGLTRARLTDFAVYHYRLLFEKPEVDKEGKPMTEDAHAGFIREEMEEWLDGDLTKLTPAQYREPARFWKYVDDSGCAEWLPTLAVAVLSLAVNTATCERLFSDLGAIHSLKRNRLDPQKVRYIYSVRRHVRAQDAVASGPPDHKIISPAHRPVLAEPLGSGLQGSSSPRTRSPSESSDSSSGVSCTSPSGDEDEEEAHDDGPEQDAIHTVDFWTELLDERFEPNSELQSGFQNSHPSQPVREVVVADGASIAPTAPTTVLSCAPRVITNQATSLTVGTQGRLSRRARARMEALDPMEPIPDPVKKECPAENDEEFPQYQARGFRTWSIRLDELFSEGS